MSDSHKDTSIDEAIDALAQWTREGEELVRYVPIAVDDQANLEQAVMKVADEMDHHPVIDHEPGGLRFRLWTHSVGRITEKDVELASRIDQTLSGTVQD